MNSKFLIALLVFVVAYGCGSTKEEKQEATGIYHRVQSNVELLLPEKYVYFNLEDNKARIKEKVSDAGTFQWLDYAANAHHGAKMFIDTVSLTNSVIFYSSAEHVPLTKENINEIIAMIENEIYSVGGEIVREGSTLIRVGDKNIFRLKYSIGNEGRRVIYYVVSNKLKTIGLNIYTYDDNDMLEYVKKIKF